MSLSITEREKLPQNGIKIRNQTSSHQKKTRETTVREFPTWSEWRSELESPELTETGLRHLTPDSE